MPSQEENFYSSFVTGAIIVLAILVYLIISIFRQHQKFRKLDLAKIDAEIKTLENERKRIAADLHDEVGPMLSTIKIQMNHLKEALPKEANIANISAKNIDDVIQKMREISNGLMPNLLMIKGLEIAMKEYIVKQSKENGIEIHFQSKCECRAPMDIEINIFRIVQEIIHNTVKHAKATKLTIQLIVMPNLLRLASEDDGVGFVYKNKIGKTGGLGLLNLSSRAETMGGEMTVTSYPNEGVKYLFEIPLKFNMAVKTTGHINIVIADDHEMFRDGLKLMLSRESEITVVAEASNGEELVEMVTNYKPNVVITDLKMPRLDGIGATKIISQKFPEIGILGLSMFDEDELIMEMLNVGALGYLVKNAEKQEVIEAIKSAFWGEHYYCKQTNFKLAEMIAKSKFNPYINKRKVQFSERENEIIQLICKELTNKEIADKIFISVRTVEGYRLRILEKMGVKNSIGLVIYAIQHGIFLPSR